MAGGDFTSHTLMPSMWRWFKLNKLITSIHRDLPTVLVWQFGRHQLGFDFKVKHLKSVLIEHHCGGIAFQQPMVRWSGSVPLKRKGYRGDNFVVMTASKDDNQQKQNKTTKKPVQIDEFLRLTWTSCASFANIIHLLSAYGSFPDDTQATTKFMVPHL